MSISNRAVGILVMENGVIIDGCPTTDDRTDLVVRPDIPVGAIVRDHGTGRWRYDEKARQALGIVGDPDFPTDIKAGNEVSRLARLDRVRQLLFGRTPEPARPRDDGGEAQT